MCYLTCANARTVGIERVAEWFGVKERTLRNRMAMGTFPRPRDGDRFDPFDLADVWNGTWKVANFS